MLYRVEGLRGLGPYHCNSESDVLDDFLYEMNSRHSEDVEGHPAPQTDGFFMHRYHYCCFSSLLQLKNWFAQEELQGLYERDYRVYEIEGDLVAELPKQSIVRAGYRRIRELLLEDLL